jgi:hypothetical protein
MAHKRKKDEKNKTTSYTIEDALKVADDVFKLSKNNKYNSGAFIHGLVFALEYVQLNYRIPPQQLADIRRGCRKYFKESENLQKSKGKI